MILFDTVLRAPVPEVLEFGPTEDVLVEMGFVDMGESFTRLTGILLIRGSHGSPIFK